MVLAHMREPKRAPLLGAGQRKFEDHVEAAAECGIEACPTVAGQERDAIEGLDALEQIVGLRVGKTVVGFLDFGALAEQRIGFVEEENDTGLLGLRQELCEVLLGLPYIFAGDGGEIRAVERQTELSGEPTRGQRLAGPGLAGEQRAHAGMVTRYRGGA